jgi:hypothetical protein
LKEIYIITTVHRYRKRTGGRLMQQIISHYRNCLTHQPMNEDQRDLVTFIYDV